MLGPTPEFEVWGKERHRSEAQKRGLGWIRKNEVQAATLRIIESVAEV